MDLTKNVGCSISRTVIDNDKFNSHAVFAEDFINQTNNCTGKYKWSGSICHYAAREVQGIRGVLAVFAERRQDRNGPYVILRSVTLN